jgi:hypothetical protein
VYLYVHSLIYLSVQLCFCLYVYLYVHSLICLSVQLCFFLCWFINLSVCSNLFLSFHLSVH